jgi:hypothetical protein
MCLILSKFDLEFQKFPMDDIGPPTKNEAQVYCHTAFSIGNSDPTTKDAQNQ